MRALIDSDICLYAVGFTVEDIEEEEGIVRSRVDQWVNGLLEATSADSYSLYLTASGKRGFRYTVDPTYKGNREAPKPKWFQFIKDYLISEWKAEEQVQIECDDRLGIEQYKAQDGETIIVTIDKDLDMICGMHYRWPIMRKGEVVTPARFYKVEEPDATRHFYKQMLIGDKSDNIVGIEGIGPKKASALLDGIDDEQEMFNIVRYEYSDDERMLKNGRLLWIWRKENDDWLQHYERLANESISSM